MNLILYILLLSILNMSTSFIIVFTHLLLDYLGSSLLSRETLEDPDDLEELRHMTFQESEGSRGVKDTIPNDFHISYTKPLKL
jgi:hypothetical protein